MRPDAIWEPVVDRTNFNFGLQDSEAAFNVGERLIAFDDIGRREIGGIGGEQQFAVHQACMRERAFVDGVRERLALGVDAHDARQMRLDDLVIEPRPGAAVRELAPARGLAVVLVVEFADPLRS